MKHFLPKIHVSRIIDSGDLLKCHHQRCGDKLQQACSEHFGKTASLEAVCLDSENHCFQVTR